MTPYLVLSEILTLSFSSSRLVGMLKAAGDESGKSSDQNLQIVFFTVCITSAENWDQLGFEWQEVLQQYGKGVNIFHMTEFEARDNTFSHFTQDDQQILLPRLVGVINKYVPVLYAAGASTSSVFRVPMDHDPIHECVKLCVEAAAREASSISPSEKIEMFFEADKEYKPSTALIYGELRRRGGIFDHLGPDTYPTKAEVIQLQVPDLFGWTARREYWRYWRNPNGSQHPALLSLMENRDCEIQITPSGAVFSFRKR